MNTSTKTLENLKIRPFNINDYDLVIQLWDKSELPYKPKGRDKKENLKSELMRGYSIFLVAELKNKIIGTIFGTHDGRKGWINRLAVDPDFRKHGLGRLLVEEVEKKLDQLGIGIIACFIEDWNSDSMIFFEKLGFKKFNGVQYFTKRKDPEV